ncbi:hypothetical protein Y1Q_0010993 [Alligator mississippiensis]|uniref:Uncharacterized protein n=1 Tax=Alligator mississippiensis TaxID=8496 RepID=A0A151NLA8_ALLMI|nr:hypothetical protein Y1Q_0010993 [Alligator mississippiensis]
MAFPSPRWLGLGVCRESLRPGLHSWPVPAGSPYLWPRETLSRVPGNAICWCQVCYRCSESERRRTDASQLLQRGRGQNKPAHKGPGSRHQAEAFSEVFSLSFLCPPCHAWKRASLCNVPGGGSEGLLCRQAPGFHLSPEDAEHPNFGGKGEDSCKNLAVSVEWLGVQFLAFFLAWSFASQAGPTPFPHPRVYGAFQCICLEFGFHLGGPLCEL